MKRPVKQDYEVKTGNSSLFKWGQYTKDLEEYAIYLEIALNANESQHGCPFEKNDDIRCVGYCDDCILYNWSDVPQEFIDHYKFD